MVGKVALSKSGKYKNGYFKPTNPQKYVGDPTNIIYRSSWEKLVCQWFDTNPSIVAWNSEAVVIPYYYKVDDKMHKYHIDFAAKIKSRDGTEKMYLIEVKPEKETKEPTTRVKKRLLTEMLTYTKNCAKWDAARAFAQSRGMSFVILTEYDLGIKKRPTT